MGRTIMGAVVSLDGYIADDNDDVAAGEIGAQALRPGLIDQVVMNVVPR